MRSLRRLSVVSAAPVFAILVLCCAGVRAQTAALPPTASVPLQIPSPFVVQMPPLVGPIPSAPQLAGPSTTLHLPPLSPGTIHRLETLDAPKLPLLARSEGPCYALRSYRFTTGRDRASVPRLSGSATCTPAAETHLKEVVKAPNH